LSLITKAVVLKQIKLAPPYHRLTLAAPAAVRLARPGQFLHVRCGITLDPLLRRPVSIHAVDRERGELTLLYRVTGRGTALLAEKKKGGAVNILGPLGKGYTMPLDAGKIAVVAGGIGIAPLFFLLQETGALGQSALVFWGASTGQQFSFPSAPGRHTGGGSSILHEMCGLGHQILLATDDGSAGYHGTVTDLFELYLNSPAAREEIHSRCEVIGTTGGQSGKDGETGASCGGSPEAMLNLTENAKTETFARVYGCGPGGMLKKLCRIIRQEEIPGEISLEERMGCGVGACLSCVCKTREGEKDGFRYGRVCVEGPVFAAGEVVWD